MRISACSREYGCADMPWKLVDQSTSGVGAAVPAVGAGAQSPADPAGRLVDAAKGL